MVVALILLLAAAGDGMRTEVKEFVVGDEVRLPVAGDMSEGCRFMVRAAGSVTCCYSDSRRGEALCDPAIQSEGCRTPGSFKVEEATEDESTEGPSVTGTCSLVLEGGAAVGDAGNYTVIFLAQLGGRREFELVVKEEGGIIIVLIIVVVAVILLAMVSVAMAVLKNLRKKRREQGGGAAGGDGTELGVGLQPSDSTQPILPQAALVCEVIPNNGRRKTETSKAGEEEQLLSSVPQSPALGDTKPGACAEVGADSGETVQKPPDLDRGMSEIGDLCNKMEGTKAGDTKWRKSKISEKITCSFCGKEFPQDYMKKHESSCTKAKENETTIGSKQQVGPSFNEYRLPPKKDDDDEDDD